MRGAKALGSLANPRREPARTGRFDGGLAAAIPHGLKLNQLRYVLSAAEQGSFRRAAAALNIQQSTISRRVRELEDRLGAAIFERDAAGVRLTPAGGRFLERARRAAEHLAEAADVVDVAGRAEQGLLRVGVVAPLGAGFLDQLLARALTQRAANELVLVEASPQAHLAALATRRLDIAFLPEPGEVRDLASRPLWRERLVVALRPDHALACRAAVAWTDLSGERLGVADDAFGGEIRARLSGRSDGAEGSTSRSAHSASLDTLLRLVALGQGLVVLAESMTGRLGAELVSRPILKAAIGFHAVWSPRNEKRALRRILGLANELAGPASSPGADRDGTGRSPGRSS